MTFITRTVFIGIPYLPPSTAPSAPTPYLPNHVLQTLALGKISTGKLCISRKYPYAPPPPPHPQKGLKFPGDGGRSLYNQKCKEMFEFPEWWWDLSKKSVLWGRIFSGTTQFIMAAQVLI